jgi:hypothetical protein
MYVRDTLIDASGSITVTANASAGNTTAAMSRCWPFPTVRFKPLGLRAVQCRRAYQRGRRRHHASRRPWACIPYVANPIIAAVNTNANAVASRRAPVTRELRIS